MTWTRIVFGLLVTTGVALSGCGDGSTQVPRFDAGVDAHVLAANGSACVDALGCLSNFCVSGVCCSTACDEAGCQACAMAMTGVPDGTCAPAFDGSICRPASGGCDTPEVCSGGVCAPDTFAAAQTECRVASGPCDLPERCDGNSATCPADGFAPAATPCRSSVGACDVADVCDGTSAACVDAFAAPTAVCRPSAGVCDPAETCSGASWACPSDTLDSAAVCRPAAGACDAAETCDGASPSCPSDMKRTVATVCRGAAGGCDIAETCTGSSDVCPGDSFMSAGTPSTCTPYVCGGAAACPTSCTMTSQCASGLTCVDNACQAAKIVFSTAAYTGNLGGLAGADAACQARAALAGVTGTYKAWLSTVSVSAASRLTHHAGPYVLITGVKVADNWTDLTDGTLDHAINYTHQGYTILGAQQAWTATTELGTSHPAGDCNGWTSSLTSYVARVGQVAQTTSNWSTAVSDYCNVGHFLYCIEQ